MDLEDWSKKFKTVDSGVRSSPLHSIRNEEQETSTFSAVAPASNATSSDMENAIGKI